MGRCNRQHVTDSDEQTEMTTPTTYQHHLTSKATESPSFPNLGFRESAAQGSQPGGIADWDGRIHCNFLFQGGMQTLLAPQPPLADVNQQEGVINQGLPEPCMADTTAQPYSTCVDQPVQLGIKLLAVLEHEVGPDASRLHTHTGWA
jgi:hypothetical protein